MTNKINNWDRFDLEDGKHSKEEVGVGIDKILFDYPEPVVIQPAGSGGMDGK